MDSYNNDRRKGWRVKLMSDKHNPGLGCREGTAHTRDLGENCPTQQTYDDDEADKEESEISAGILMDEGE